MLRTEKENLAGASQCGQAGRTLAGHCRTVLGASHVPFRWGDLRSCTFGDRTGGRGGASFFFLGLKGRGGRPFDVPPLLRRLTAVPERHFALRPLKRCCNLALGRTGLPACACCCHCRHPPLADILTHVSQPEDFFFDWYWVVCINPPPPQTTAVRCFNCYLISAGYW